jgi:hypothetical protein
MEQFDKAFRVTFALAHSENYLSPSAPRHSHLVLGVTLQGESGYSAISHGMIAGCITRHR